MPSSYVYVMSNQFRGTLYIGVTSDLVKRVYEHRSNAVDGFTKRYGLHQLVYYEIHDDVREAIQRETQMKAWKRQWKIDLIEKDNPYWNDLFDSIV